MEEIKVKRKVFTIVDKFSEDENCVTYVATNKGKKFLFSRYFQNFEAVVDDYKKLSKSGINIIKIVLIDKKEKIIVRDFIDGKTVFDELLISDLPEKYFEQLFLMYRFCRFSKININYLPDNFIMYRNQLVYISHEIGDYNKVRNLENWGIRYWFYTKEFAQYLRVKEMKVDEKRILQEEVANKNIVLLSVTYW